MADFAAPLVGRDAELAELAAAIGLDGEPEATAVLLGGDAGIGKTRLVAELVDRAAAAGHRVLVGHCLDLGESAMPFQPFVEALPELDLREGDPTTDRSGVLSVVARAVDDLAEESPVLLVIEDAHWADASTRHLLQYLLARRSTRPVFLVVTYRSDDLHRRHPLRAAIAEWTRRSGVQRLDLGPLPDASIAELLRARESRRLTSRGVTAIVRRAGGNAFYAEELLDAGLADGSLPESLADLVLVRLDRLDEAAHSVAAAIACAGGRATDALLSKVVELDDAAMHAALHTAIDQKVLVANGDAYRFRHALLAEAVRDDLLPGERRRLHSRFLSALLDGADGSAREIAHHAQGAGDLETAFTASVQAGDDAAALGGHDEAADHYRRALTLIDAAPEGVQVVDLVLAAAEALFSAGRLRTSNRLLREHLEQLAPDDVTGRGRMLVALGEAAYFADSDDEAVEVTTEALAIIPDECTPLRAQAEALRGRVAAGVNEEDAAAEHAEKALSLAEALDLVEVSADAKTTLARLLTRGGKDPAHAEAQFTDLIAQARASGDIHGELRGLHQLGFLMYNTGRLEPAERTFRELMARAQATGRSWAPYGLDGQMVVSVICQLDGRWDDTLALRDIDPRAPRFAQLMLDAVALVVRVNRGEEISRAELERFRDAWSSDIALAAHAGSGAIDYYCIHGDLEAAVEAHDALMDMATRRWRATLMPARLRLDGLLVGALAAAAPSRSATENAEAVDRAVELAALCDDVVVEHPALGPEGLAWHRRVHAELARLRWLSGIDPVPAEELERLWRETCTAFEGLGNVFEHARTTVRLAAVLKATGQEAEAKELLDAARATARRLGARPLLEEMRSGGDAPATTDLTRREREVLSLVSAGRTNGEIAAQLFISTKTASVHVSNILAKLGASSRTEAAAIANRRGLL